MTCSHCESEHHVGERFCRKCGIDLAGAGVGTAGVGLPQTKTFAENFMLAGSQDPDELTGNGIGSVIMGDGFLMVAVILGATHTAVSSLLWLLLLIPAFCFFGRGFADVLLARQIRRRLRALDKPQAAISSSPSHTSIVEGFTHYTSGELAAAPSVTERTTRQLE